MKKRIFILLLMLALLSLTVAGIQFVDLALANPTLPPSPYPETPDTTPPSIKIQLPESSKIYNAKTVPYHITVEKPASWFENGTIHGTLRSIGYILDGKENITLADCQTSYLPDFQSETRTINLEGKLSGLSEGNHTIQVWVNSESNYHPPDTPQNFYGWWAAVAEYPIETSSSIIHFSIANPTEPFPTLLVGGSVAIVTIVGAGLLVYFHKKKLTKPAIILGS
jgi:hypothetical protein